MFWHVYATVIFTLSLTVLLVFVSITMRDSRVSVWPRASHSWGDVHPLCAKPCQCNKVLYTVESRASPVIGLLAGSALGGRLHLLWRCIFMPKAKVYTVWEEPRRTLICGVVSEIQKKAKPTGVAHVCSQFTPTASSSRKLSVDFPLYALFCLFAPFEVHSKKYFTEIEIKVNFDFLIETCDLYHVILSCELFCLLGECMPVWIFVTVYFNCCRWNQFLSNKFLIPLYWYFV